MIDMLTFARAVRDMRRVQTEYFHNRGNTCLLVGARQREIAVDKLVREVLAGSDLFEHAAAEAREREAAEARACAGERTPSALRANDENEGEVGL